jgi:hypothetical protein
LANRRRVLCEVPPGVVGASGTWNTVGVILFGHGAGIYRTTAAGGAATPVTSVNPQRGETAHLLPEFLPDGRHFLYVARGAAGGSINSWIVLGSLDGSEDRQLFRASCASRIPNSLAESRIEATLRGA